MSLYTYVDQPNSNLICCICRMPFTNPVSTRCSHTFCRDCIQQALTHAPQCPVDRSPLALDELAPADPIVRSLVDELVVECTHSAEGCEHTCQRQLLAVHLKDECPYADVSCSEEDCDVTVLRMDMAEHTKIHGIESDEEEPEETRVSQGVQTLSASSQEHEISALKEQNILLRHHINSMETMMLNMKRELTTVKAALGPWCRGNPTVHRENTAEQASTSAAAASYFHYVDDAPREHEEPYGFQPFPNTRMGHRPSSSVDHPAYARPISASIAPLNLGGTLEGTFSGLRESMVTLAAGVDSLGRRSEIALTNETLRLGEEVMSLRAGLHGLRMQVHAMMMDRNALMTGREPIPGPEGWLPPPLPPRMHFGQPQSFTKL